MAHRPSWRRRRWQAVAETSLRLGIIGAGKSGIAIARIAVAAGLHVAVAGNRPALQTAMLVKVLAPGAASLRVGQLIASSDIVVLAIPLHRWREVPLDRLADKIVIDPMNYWPPVDGVLEEFQSATLSSSEIIQKGLPDSALLVKTFNHLGYHDIEERVRPHGATDRIGLGLAGNHPTALNTVAAIVDRLGFDPITVGDLPAGRILQPGGPIFGALYTRQQIEDLQPRLTDEFRSTEAAAASTIRP